MCHSIRVQNAFRVVSGHCVCIYAVVHCVARTRKPWGRRWHPFTKRHVHFSVIHLSLLRRNMSTLDMKVIVSRLANAVPPSRVELSDSSLSLTEVSMLC